MSNIYKHIHIQSTKRYLDKFPHYATPDVNVHSDADLLRENYPSVNYTKPVPFLPPVSVSVEVWCGGDPGTDIVKKKLHWRNEIESFKQLYMKKNEKESLIKTMSEIVSEKAITWDALPRDAHFVKLASSNPDKEFDGAYNWYYTGGSLDVMQFNNMHVLLTTQGHNRDHLRVIKLKNKKYWKRSSTVATELCTPNQPIYQIRGSYNTECICVRHRRNCHIYLLTDQLELRHIHSSECETAFTSIDVNPHTAGMYATTTTRKLVKEWNASGRTTFTHSIHSDEEFDNWCSVSYTNNPHGLIVADRRNIYMLDKRSKKPNEKLCPTEENKMLEDCEDISVVLNSCVNNHALYVCSSHSVLLYDMRSSSKPLQCLTHFMSNPPLLACTISPQKNEEVICIGNQNPGEVVTIRNKWNGKSLDCYSCPLGLQNMRDTLFSAHACGLWLDPVVQHRAKLSLAGLAWLPPVNSELMLLSQTCVGDVFSQTQATDSDSKSIIGFGEQRDLKYLAKWEKVLLEERKSSPLNVTSIKSMKHVFNHVKSSRNTLPDYQIPKEDGQQSWEVSKKRLESYVDLLAPRILDVWEIEDEPEWAEDEKNLQEEPLCQEEGENRVESWLTSISSRREKDEFLPISVSTPYENKSKQGKRKSELNKSLLYTNENYDENFEDLTASQSKKRKSSAKHEYVLGF